MGKMSGRVEGFGSITWWGFSPAMDLTAIAGRPGELREIHVARVKK